MNLKSLWKSPKVPMTIRYVLALCVIGIFSSLRTLSRQTEFSAQLALQTLTDAINEQHESLLKVELLVESYLLNDERGIRHRIQPALEAELSKLKAILQNYDVKNIGDISRHVNTEKTIPILKLDLIDLREKLTFFINRVDEIISSNEGELKKTKDIVSYHNTKRYLEIEEIFKNLDSTLSYVATQEIHTYSKWDMGFYIGNIFFMILIALFLFRPMVNKVALRDAEQSITTTFLERRNDELALSRESLRQQTRILKSMLYGLNNAIIVVDENQKVIVQNKSAENLFGVLSRDSGLSDCFKHLESRGKDSMDLNLKTSIWLSPFMLSRALIEKSVMLKNERFPGGLDLNLVVTPLLDEEGNQKGAIFAFTDLSEKITKDKDLDEARQEAERANRAKSVFLANMSHEIRTPISIILGFTDKLLLTDQKPEEFESSLKMIVRNARILKELIDGILDISKIEAGQLQIERARVDLVELVNEVYGSVSEKAKEKGLLLKIHADSPIPKFIETDSLRLKQILLNILNNAIKFTPTGEISVRIRVVQCESSHRLQFIVTDTGIGIAPEGVDRLFVPFAQADSSTARSYGGTGLGLALSRNLARALGGELRLASTSPNVGSTFVVSVNPGQLSDTEFIADIKLSESKLSPYKNFVRAGDLRGIKVLIVEDVEENRDLCAHFIGMAGATIELAVDGYEAVEKTPVFSPDVILMDIQMPKMDGHEAVKRLRNNGYHGSIIAVTAHALQEEKERCLRSGFDEYLVKPIDFNVVCQRIKFFAETAPATMPETPESQLLAVVKPNAIIEGIKKKFVVNLRDRLDLISQAIDENNLAVLREESHKIRGVAGACGYIDLAANAGTVEDSIFQKQSQDVIIKNARKLEKLTAYIIEHNMEGNREENIKS